MTCAELNGIRHSFNQFPNSSGGQKCSAGRSFLTSLIRHPAVGRAIAPDFQCSGIALIGVFWLVGSSSISGLSEFPLYRNRTRTRTRLDFDLLRWEEHQVTNAGCEFLLLRYGKRRRGRGRVRVRLRFIWEASPAPEKQTPETTRLGSSGASFSKEFRSGWRPGFQPRRNCRRSRQRSGSSRFERVLIELDLRVIRVSTLS